MGKGEKLVFKSGMLSRQSNAVFMQRMEQLMAEFSELDQQDTSLPLAERFGTSVVAALRVWELPLFSRLRRHPNEKVF